MVGTRPWRGPGDAAEAVLGVKVTSNRKRDRTSTLAVTFPAGLQHNTQTFAGQWYVVAVDKTSWRNRGRTAWLGPRGVVHTTTHQCQLDNFLLVFFAGGLMGLSRGFCWGNTSGTNAHLRFAFARRWSYRKLRGSPRVKNMPQKWLKTVHPFKPFRRREFERFPWKVRGRKNQAQFF